MGLARKHGMSGYDDRLRSGAVFVVVGQRHRDGSEAVLLGAFAGEGHAYFLVDAKFDRPPREPIVRFPKNVLIRHGELVPWHLQRKPD